MTGAPADVREVQDVRDVQGVRDVRDTRAADAPGPFLPGDQAPCFGPGPARVLGPTHPVAQGGGLVLADPVSGLRGQEGVRALGPLTRLRGSEP